MTPGARIQAAMELLDDVWQSTQATDVLTDAYFRKRRYAGSSDRRAIQDYIYAVLRRRARLDWWIERTGQDVPSQTRARVIAYLTLVDRLPSDGIAERFSGVRHCPAELAPAEIELADALYGRPLNHRDMPSPAAYEYPAWMEPSLAALWGNDLNAEIAALNEKAPVDLRVNTLKATREEAAKVLAEAFVETQETEFSPLGLRVEGHPRLGGTEAFKTGLVEVQDEGSQLVSLLCGARPGMNVIDYCAGAGGKTLALAAAMARDGALSGKLTACDISKTRLERLRPRLKRAGAYGVKCRTIRPEKDDWVEAQKSRADRVLIDAPCTGTGTWRRDPNAKWRFTPTDLEHLVAQQQLILREAAALVKPGGRLIYVTCSLLPEENEHQLAWFLNEHPDFHAVSVADVWNETIGGMPLPDGPFLRLSPSKTGTDGFFCTILET